jgi:cytochrome oxidase Cu insertion factor (SCO1/SenC/PrrC family)
LLYFGFTHCPDICPEELDKMGDAVDILEKDVGEGTVLPVFFSVDPARDSVEQVKRYLTGELAFQVLPLNLFVLPPPGSRKGLGVACMT